MPAYRIDRRPFHQLLRSALNQSSKAGNARQLAEASGLSETMVGRYLREEDPVLPSYEAIVQLADGLDTTPNKLMGYCELETEIYKRRMVELWAAALPLRDVVEAQLRRKYTD